MKSRKFFAVLLAPLSLLFFPVFGQNQSPSVETRIDELLSRMTLEEKVGQLNQYSGRELTGPASEKKADLQSEIENGWVGSMLNVKGAKNTREVQRMALKSRLKIPLLFGLDVIHGYKTTFPIPLAEAASWDLEAIKLSARLAAREAAASGIHWTFAPMVDIARDPRWGRIMEGAGEDPYLGSAIAVARVRGFQGERLGSTESIMACAKHFAAYGAAIGGRDYNAVEMSDHELWQTYLTPFKAAADAGVASFMNSFNTLNGIPATGSSHLQRDILKGKWKYQGFVVSDWNSIGEMAIWGYAKDLEDAAQKAITAGSDMDMEGAAYRKHLVELKKNGKLDEALINGAVRRVLRKKFELGLFDNPFKFSDEKREAKVLSDKATRTSARDIARKSIVLLKNDNQVLPLRSSVKTIALIGPLAKSRRNLEGSWIVNTDTSSTVSLYEGLNNALTKDQQLLYASGGSVASSGDKDLQEAFAVAQKADLVILALGESWDMSGESKSRADLHLPGDQEKLFEMVRKSGKPIVTVIMAGRPLLFNSVSKYSGAVLYAWWLGSEAGNAIADVVLGKYNPSGKLPVTFPRSMGQIPVFYSSTKTGRPYTDQKNKLYLSAYIDEENTPAYAFGHGLSYTRFSYSDLEFSKEETTVTDSLKVSFKLTNTGKYPGEEVVQLYLRDEVASVVRPLKELKDFRKLMLQPGESRIVSFSIDKEKLAFYDDKLNLITEPGMFTLMLGSSSDDIRLQKTFALR